MSRPETPLLTVDVIIRLQDQPDAPLVLIERKHPPQGWALPGGFVDIGETLEQAAVREAREETGLHVQLQLLLGCYSDPQRDPRGHTVSAVFVADARGEPQAADDAKAVKLATLDKLPADLVFDHGRILEDYLHYLQTGEGTPLRTRQ